MKDGQPMNMKDANETGSHSVVHGCAFRLDETSIDQSTVDRTGRIGSATFAGSPEFPVSAMQVYTV